jgi:ABC-type amino acid transport substrate-binding protein
MIPLPADASIAARIRARGHLLVGVRYDDEPFGIVDGEGNLVGFDVELGHEFALRWLGDREALRFVQVTNSTVAERVESAQVDLVIGALPRNQSAARDIDYSAAYYYDGLSLAVRSTRLVTEGITIEGPQSLDGVPVGVVEESDTEAPLLRAAGSAVPQIEYYPDYFAAIAGLESGVVAAVVGPRRTLARLTAGSADLGLTPRFTRSAYAIGVPKGDGPFLDLVNATLMSLIGDGTYLRLFQQWLPGEVPPELESWVGTSRYTFEAASDTLVPPPNTVSDIEARGYVIVGLLDDQLPFSDFDANSVAQGFLAELGRTLAARWLGDVAAVQFVLHSEESGVAALQAGQIDLLAAPLPHTLRRDDEIDFSQTLYQGGIGLLVSAGSGVNALAGLNGAVVAALSDGVTADAVQQAAAQVGVTVSVQGVNDVNEALRGVAEGRFQAYADWRTDLLNLAYTYSGFLVLDDRLTKRPIALGVRQNDASFRDLVNFTLQELAAAGRFAALYDDWFGTDPPYPVEIWPGAPYLPLRLESSPAAAPEAP